MENYEKKYKEVLAKAQELAKNNPSDEGIQNWIKDSFPELRESEDEKIRKEILEYIKTGTYKNGWVDWLEKQGEQKPTEWSEGDNQIIDGLISICDEAQDNFPLSTKPAHIKALKYWLQNLKGRALPQPKQEWSKEDEIILNFLIDYLLHVIARTPPEEDVYGLGKAVTLLKTLKVRIVPQPKQEWNSDDEQYLLICKNALAKYQVSDKWDAGIISRWLENRLRQTVHQPQPEWSEEDEKRRQQAITALDRNGYNILVDWLRSLRPQPRWKPSEEQMKALASSNVPVEHLEAYETLWSDLKKLIE